MRHVTWTFGLAATLLAAGCTNSRFSHVRPNTPGAAVAAAKPTVPELVAYLKRNADQIQSLECNTVDIDYRQGLQSYGADAKIACQKPRNFRLGVFAFGGQQVDMGSNAQEFWYWIAKSDPAYVFRCSYQDFERGVELPFPFQPEWIMEGLGMGEYGAPEQYRLRGDAGKTWELVEQVRNSQGQTVYKVTEFSKGRVQLRGFKLLDAKGTPIYTAQVDDVHVIGGVVVPRKVAFHWPEQKLSLTMKLGRSADQVVLNRQIPPAEATALFSRSNLNNIPEVDLAAVSRRANGQIQPAGGAQR